MTGIIYGTGACTPSYIMDNNDIAKLVETSDEWIQERTGVARRHIITEETTVSMAVQAGRRALENAGVSPEEVDLILVATISSNVILPCTACQVQKELGAIHATCFDLGGAACTGFVLAYNTATAYLAGGVYKTALVIGSESLSNLTNWKDPGYLHPVRRRSRSRRSKGRGREVLSSGNPFGREQGRRAHLQEQISGQRPDF